MASWLLWLMVPAHAASFALSGGPTGVVNDPFVFRRGLGVNFEMAANRNLGLEARVAYYGTFGTGDWKPITKQIVNENEVSPDLSYLICPAHIGGRLTPIHGYLGPYRMSLGAVVGLGASQTFDDLVMVGQEENEAAIATQSQWHPTTVFGLLASVEGDRAGLRMRAMRLTYIEVRESTTFQMKGTLVLAPEVVWWF